MEFTWHRTTPSLIIATKSSISELILNAFEFGGISLNFDSHEAISLWSSILKIFCLDILSGRLALDEDKFYRRKKTFFSRIFENCKKDTSEISKTNFGSVLHFICTGVFETLLKKRNFHK